MGFPKETHFTRGLKPIVGASQYFTETSLFDNHSGNCGLSNCLSPKSSFFMLNFFQLVL